MYSYQSHRMTIKTTYLRFLAPALVCCLILLNSCQRDLDYIVQNPNAGPDTTWVNTPDSSMPVGQLQNALLLQTRTDSFTLNAGTAITVDLSSGLRAAVTAGALWNDSSLPAFGLIHARSLLLTRKGDFIRMGITTSESDRALETGGAYFLRFQKDQEELHVSQGRQIIGIFDAPATFQDMSVYSGSATTIPLMFDWSREQDSLNNFVVAPGQSYSVYSNKLNWISASRPAASIQQNTTRIALDLPSNYTNQNSKAYIVLNNKLCIVPMPGNASLRQFISYPVLSGEQATVVVISRQGNDYFMGTQQITTNPVTTGTQLVSVTPTITTLNNMITFLNSL